MKMVSALLFLFCVVVTSFISQAQIVSNKVVFVDQDGKINAPEVVASVADMTSNRTEIAIAQASANAAEKAAREGTNLVSATVKSITDNEFVVYRRGFTDSLGVMVVLPPDTQYVITEMKPNIATDGNGNAQHELVYATTADASKVPPKIKHASTIDDGREGFKVLDTQVEKTDLATSYEDAVGTVYNYMYSVKFWLPINNQGFFIVYLDADAADGDGFTFDIKGGATGGYTGNITVGDDTLIFKGGFLMGVENAKN
jgi:hypothetical protein